MRLLVLPVFMQVLSVCVCDLCGQPCIYRCGVYVCSTCVRLLGVHFQPHYWLDLGTRSCSSLASVGLLGSVAPYMLEVLVLSTDQSSLPSSH